jgi:hypothetical protein
MVELSTGYLNFAQLDAEILNIVDDLLAFGIDTVYITFGFGCERDRAIQWEEIPVAVRGLAQFIADSEADETFELGESDLHIRGGGVEFLLCHEGDVHCTGNMCPLLAAVRRRWTCEYEHSHEKRSGGPWHRLTGRPKDSRHDW